MLRRKVDQAARPVEGLASRLHVPLVFELVAVAREPPRIAEHRRGDGADARLGQRVDPAVEGRRDIDHGGDAAHQQLGERHAHGGDRAFPIIVEDRQELIKRAVPEAGAARLVGDALAQRLATRMGMNIDEARKKEPLRAVDLHIARLGTIFAEERDLPVANHQIDVAAVNVPAAGPRPTPRPMRLCGIRWSVAWPRSPSSHRHSAWAHGGLARSPVHPALQCADVQRELAADRHCTRPRACRRPASVA